MYSVKEMFYTLQGEGYHTGTPAVFIRFAGCNLWSGREEDRERDVAKGGCARWCDTDFRGTDGAHGGRYDAQSLASRAAAMWPKALGRMVVLTGGEPALQVDNALVSALHGEGFAVHMETNGTVPIAHSVDWVTVSPKPPSEPLARHYDEVKVVTDGLADVARWRPLARYGFVQPVWVQDPDERTAIAARCVEYVKRNPSWRLGIQAHKYWGIA